MVLCCNSIYRKNLDIISNWITLLLLSVGLPHALPFSELWVLSHIMTNKTTERKTSTVKSNDGTVDGGENTLQSNSIESKTGSKNDADSGKSKSGSLNTKRKDSQKPNNEPKPSVSPSNTSFVDHTSKTKAKRWSFNVKRKKTSDPIDDLTEPETLQRTYIGFG